MTIEQWLWSGAVAAVACGVQSAVGFGSGVVAIPLLVWGKLPLPTAVAVMLPVTIAQCAWGVWRHRRDLRDEQVRRNVIWLTVLRLISMPLGLLLLAALAAGGTAAVKQAVGGTLLAVLILRWTFRVKPRPSVGPAWTGVTGLVSGVLMSGLGMGGPPIVLWVMAHDWPGRKARALLWATFLPPLPILAVLLWWKFGAPAAVGMGVGVTLIPLALAGSAAGLWAGRKLDGGRLRVAMTVLLVIIAVASIVAPAS